jgi:hypothetical protein
LWTHEIEAARALTFSKLDENSPIGDVYRRNSDTFTRLQRRIDSTERSYYRALTHLQRLRQGNEDRNGPGPEPRLSPLESETPDTAPLGPAAQPPDSAAGELASFAQSPEAFCFRKHPIGSEMGGRPTAPQPALLLHGSPADCLLDKFV